MIDWHRTDIFTALTVPVWISGTLFFFRVICGDLNAVIIYSVQTALGKLNSRNLV